jgi:hypothetical protein
MSCGTPDAFAVPMNRSRLVALTALLGSTFLAADVSSAITTREIAGGVSTQVSIGTAPAEPWKASTVQLDIELQTLKTTDATGKLVTVLRTGKRTYGATKISKFLPGALSAYFDTDLATNVSKIAFDPTVTDVVESVVGDARAMTRPQPGNTKLGRVTFTMAPSRTVGDWVRGFTTGGATPRDITVNMKTPTGVVVRSVSLKRALPASYSTDGHTVQLTVQPESMVVGGTAHKAAIEWFQGNLTGALTRRDVRISYLDAAGAALAVTTLKGAFISEMSWSTLSPIAKDAVTESFTLVPESVDPLP